MKKKMSIIILLMMVVMLTACGTKETVDADMNNQSTEEVYAKDPATVPEVSELVSTPEPEAPAAPVVSDKIDLIVDVDIPVGGQSEKVEFPELHLYVTGDLVEQVNAATTRYEIPNAVIHFTVSARYFQGPDYCWETYQVPHYETANYGRYLVDIDYQEKISYGATYITVYDTEMEAGIKFEVSIGTVNETAPTDEERSYVKQYALMEAEYVKEQVAAWSQDFVPGSGTEVGTAAPVETVAEEKVYALDACPDITVTLSYSDNGTMLTCLSPYDETIQCELVQTESGILQALDETGEMFMEITVGDGKIFLDTPFMEYANFYGDYTLKE